MSRILAVLGVVALSAVSALVMAPAASAASYSTTLTCVGAPGLSTNTFGVDPGDTVTVNAAGGGPPIPSFNATASSGGMSPSGFDAGGGASATFTITTGFSGASIAFNCGGTQTLTLTGGGGGGSSSDSSSTSSAPAPVMQQFGKPASGTCDAAALATLDWAGVSSGGWGESWSEWMNGGLGGAVCTRTLVYSESAGAWTVA